VEEYELCFVQEMLTSNDKADFMPFVVTFAVTRA